MRSKNLGTIHATVSVDTRMLSGICPDCVYRANEEGGTWCAKFGAFIVALECQMFKERK
jgi:hypothetical protein